MYVWLVIAVAIDKIDYIPRIGNRSIIDFYSVSQSYVRRHSRK